MTSHPVTIIGHRGAALRAPENTLASFRRALADGADGVECDVHLSADASIVVMHDETIDRTVDPSSPRATGALAELTRAELDEVQLEGGEHVPSLAELLALLDEHAASARRVTPLQAYVEVKAVPAAEAVARALAGRPGMTVISFHVEALEAVRRTVPEIPLGFLVETPDAQALATRERIGAEWLAVDVEAITPEAVEAVHAAGARVNVWTVNTPQQARRAVASGADSISTDDPAWLRALLAEGMSADHDGRDAR